jgi:hypothetical protein
MNTNIHGEVEKSIFLRNLEIIEGLVEKMYSRSGKDISEDMLEGLIACDKVVSRLLAIQLAHMRPESRDKTLKMFIETLKEDTLMILNRVLRKYEDVEFEQDTNTEGSESFN